MSCSEECVYPVKCHVKVFKITTLNFLNYVVYCQYLLSLCDKHPNVSHNRCPLNNFFPFISHRHGNHQHSSQPLVTSVLRSISTTFMFLDEGALLIVLHIPQFAGGRGRLCWLMWAKMQMEFTKKKLAKHL